MSIKIIENEDILNTDCKYIVNSVNCTGNMNTELSKKIISKYPEMYDEYKRLCMVKAYELGKPRIHQVNDGKYIINFPVTLSENTIPKFNDIENGLNYLKDRLKIDYDIDNIPLRIAFTPIGVEFGLQDSKDKIINIIKKEFDDITWCDIDLYI